MTAIALRLATLGSLLGLAVAAGHDHDGHDHDGHDHEAHGESDMGFEWAGIFATPENIYMWTAQKVNGAYADPAMKLVALPATDITEAGLHALEEEGKHSMEKNCTEVEAGETIVPAEDTCYHLHFQADAWQTLFNVDASGVSGIAFFAEHVPTEFEATAHYLKDSDGDDIEPVAQLPEATTEATATATGLEAAPIVAAILVNIITFVGVVLLFPPLRRAVEKPVFSAMLFAFASGALLACAFFLLLFEATHLIGVGWSAEVDILWRWGTMILAGMVVPPVVETLVSLVALARSPASTAASPESGEKEAEDPVAKFRAKARLLGAVLIGDFFHNLCDGFFIGAAFRGCGDSFGWGVAIGTILHELPQEIADFVVLTGPEVALTPLKALAANFISGLSVLIGAIIILSSSVDDSVVGLILAFGGGVYLHIGATDCLPKMYNPKLSFGERLLAFLSFIIGAVLIGLILLDHEHCIPEGAEGHGGHGGHGDTHGGGH